MFSIKPEWNDALRASRHTRHAVETAVKRLRKSAGFNRVIRRGTPQPRLVVSCTWFEAFVRMDATPVAGYGLTLRAESSSNNITQH
ncbi:hypothetical protein [Paraburkholderia sp. DHOC27]|uniref:hypothetical protein n=1 Tax=Paraburkholderia sp. DHOC27 TaxID=2303330 RepID=UPI0011C15A74|nr:hypothetical protein [Paraburkholderia sp. DHOC27]